MTAIKPTYLCAAVLFAHAGIAGAATLEERVADLENKLQHSGGNSQITFGGSSANIVMGKTHHPPSGRTLWCPLPSPSLVKRVPASCT
jgi:hypothetical protein